MHEEEIPIHLGIGAYDVRQLPLGRWKRLGGRYIAGGLVAAAPGGGLWFHEHLPIAKDRMRLLQFWGGPTPRLFTGEPGEERTATGVDIPEGGNAIPYRDEDPWVRKTYVEELKKEGAEITMPEEVYR